MNVAVVDTAFLALTLIGAAYYVASTYALVLHFRSGRETPFRHDTGVPPKISVLKPVSGLDSDARANFESYLRQDYPDYEVLFGVLEPSDPAIPAIRDIIRASTNASLHVGSEAVGANNKVRILCNLAMHAAGDILVVTDADTRAAPHFLRGITSYLADESVGVVTCLYRGTCARNVADALEGLHMTCVFAPGVACADRLSGIDFGLGAAIAIRGSVLDEIGGFEPIVDYLADDFQLGRRAARAGHRVVLSDHVVDIVLSGGGMRTVFARELRWSRTTKASRPWGHAGLAFTFGFAYALLYLAVSRFSLTGWCVLAAVAGIRAATAWVGARKCMRDRAFVKRIYLLPVRDVLSFAIWIAGYFSRRVTWRKRTLRLTQGGRMTEV